MNFENPSNKVSLANNSVTKLSALQFIGLFVLSLLAVSFWGCSADGDKSKTDEHKEQLSSDTIPLVNKPKVSKVMIKKDPSTDYNLLFVSNDTLPTNGSIFITLTSRSESMRDTIASLAEYCSKKGLRGILSTSILNRIHYDTTYRASITGDSIDPSTIDSVSIGGTLPCPER